MFCYVGLCVGATPYTPIQNKKIKIITTLIGSGYIKQSIAGMTSYQLFDSLLVLGGIVVVDDIVAWNVSFDLF